MTPRLNLPPISTNSRLATYEVDGHKSDDTIKFKSELKSLSAIPRTRTKLHQFEQDMQGWVPLPGLAEEMVKLGLPTDPASNENGRWGRGTKILEHFKFGSTGRSQLFDITISKNNATQYVFPTTTAGAWKEIVAHVMMREHPDCEQDAISYRKGPLDLSKGSPNAALWVPSGFRLGKSPTSYRVVIDELDKHGLVPATLTGISFLYYNNKRERIYTLTRKVGSDDTGPEYQMLSKTAAILRLVLCMERKKTYDQGLGRIFQGPPDIPSTVAQEIKKNDPVYSDADLARGYQICDSACQGYTAYTTMYEFAWSWNVYGVVQGQSAGELDRPVITYPELILADLTVRPCARQR